MITIRQAPSGYRGPGAHPPQEAQLRVLFWPVPLRLVTVMVYVTSASKSRMDLLPPIFHKHSILGWPLRPPAPRGGAYPLDRFSFKTSSPSPHCGSWAPQSPLGASCLRLSEEPENKRMSGGTAVRLGKELIFLRLRY